MSEKNLVDYYVTVGGGENASKINCLDDFKPKTHLNKSEMSVNLIINYYWTDLILTYKCY